VRAGHGRARGERARDVDSRSHLRRAAAIESSGVLTKCRRRHIPRVAAPATPRARPRPDRCAPRRARADRPPTRPRHRATVPRQTNVGTSPGATPNSIDAIERRRIHAANTPTASPASTLQAPSRATSKRTSRVCAPSATRTPISRVRCVTAKATSAATPTAANIKAMTANAETTMLLNPMARMRDRRPPPSLRFRRPSPRHRAWRWQSSAPGLPQADRPAGAP
jgi:hypothetical protein